MFVVDLDPIPLAESDEQPTISSPHLDPIPNRARERTDLLPSPAGKWVARALIVCLGSLHGLAIWLGLGGYEGLTNGWPLWRDDHPLYYHCALVTRAFLKNSGTTAGYDPSFMAGYAKSAVFPSSSTLPDLVIAAFGGEHPEIAYKLYVLISAAAVPWLITLACALWRVPPAGAAIAVLLDLLYVWSDFPIQYVTFGMIPYFLAVPAGLVATGVFARFLTQGGAINWLLSAAFVSLAVLVHFTTAMVIVPAASAAYIAAVVSQRADRASARHGRRVPPLDQAGSGSVRRLTLLSHLAVWTIPFVVLAVNSFWWLPGVRLASTKGPSDFAFIHPEGVVLRLAKIFTVEASIQSILIFAGVPALVFGLRRSLTLGCALVAFCAAGFFWGYLAGGSRELDFLQPGRHTYACYTALAVACGAGLDELRQRLRAGQSGADRLDLWVLAGAVLIGFRLVGYPQVGSQGLIKSIQVRLIAGEPFLSSRPSPRLLWVVENVRRHVRPGERLLYEEGGFGLEGESDPFQRGRFSGLLPERTGVEVIGGPYLHASLKTNFTQFGEGKLFNRNSWDGCELAFIPANGASVMPTQGRNLFVVAGVDNVFRFRIFDAEGRIVADTDEKRLTEQARQIEELRKQLKILWPPHELSKSEKARVVAAIASIVGHPPWDRPFFIRYANLYRPSAILCWSEYARRFCLENPDLVKVVEDDGTVLIGRIIGFEGDFIVGGGQIEARHGRIRIRELSPGLDGSVVLRYHSVPYLSTSPSVACEPEYREDDPVPFIRLRPPAGTSGIDLEMHFPVGR